MLLIVGVGLLGLVVGSMASYLLAKRGTVIEVPSKQAFMEGVLVGYEAAWEGATPVLYHKRDIVESVDQATHMVLWCRTESGIPMPLATVTNKVTLAADKIA